MLSSIWFWQRIVSPHMVGLASALADNGHVVTYVAELPMSADRVAQGWLPPHSGSAHLIYAQDSEATAEAARRAPKDSVHICQGLRGNGLVETAQAVLTARKLRQWVVMETVEGTGWRGFARQLEYRRLIAARRRIISGYLAIGHQTPGWLAQRGAQPKQVFPFAYFLTDTIRNNSITHPSAGPFRILFVGRFIELKRLDLLIRAVASLGRDDVELQIVGSGPLEKSLRQLGMDLLGSRVSWIGSVPSPEVVNHMAAADLLVLPSSYDGWGAVVSEAIMAGTPVICSDACGSAGVVQASGQGGVFPSRDSDAFIQLLRRVVNQGRPSKDQRVTLARWGGRLGARAGADYLTAILAFREGHAARPVPPWATSGNAGR